MELYALTQNLTVAGAVSFSSLIWIDRYNRIGSCEVYAPATEENVALLKVRNYLYRSTGGTVMLIKDVKTSGNAETGFFITAYGYDAKCYLDQRVNTRQRMFLSDANSDTATSSKLSILLNNVLRSTDQQKGFWKPSGSRLFASNASPDQVFSDANANIANTTWGEIARLICGTFGGGYKVVLYNAALRLKVYMGTERPGVTFSQKFSNIGNVELETDIRDRRTILVCNTDEYFVNAEYGLVSSGVERVEVPMLLSTARTVSLGELRTLYDCGNFRVVNSGSNSIVLANAVTVPVMGSPWYADYLENNTDGSVDQWFRYCTFSSATLGTIKGVAAADVTDDTPVTDALWSFYYRLLSEAAAQYEEITDIDRADVEIIDHQFVYGRDYFLGDVVTVDAGFGPAPARIVEVLECYDENGYRLEPRTSYSDILDE